MSTEGFAIASRLTLTDWHARQTAVAMRAPTRGARGIAVLVGVPVVFAVLASALLDFGPARGHADSLVLGMLVGYGALLVVGRILRRMIRPAADGAFLGDWRLEFTPAGIAVRRPFVDSHVRWNAVRDVTATQDHIFVWLDSVAAFIVPVRDLPSGLSSHAAQEILRTLAANPSEPSDDGSIVPPLVPAPVTAPPQPPASIARSLGALFDVFAGRPVDGPALAAPDGAIAAVAALTAVLTIGLERIGAGPDAEFSWLGAGRLAWEELLLIAVAWLVTRATDPRGEWRRILFVLVALAPLLVIGSWLGEHFLWRPWRELLQLAVGAGGALYLARGLTAAVGRAQRRAVLVAIVMAFAAWVAVPAFLDDGPLWTQPYDEPDAADSAAPEDGERLLVAQGPRIESALAALAPRSGASSVYMVGFAGVGEQKVFAEEVNLAARVLGERYDSRRRTVLLVNDRRDRESRPLATVTGLELALAGIGSQMDRDRDVLVLYISSHGSADPAISVSNGGLPLQELTGVALKKALDGSRIRWRVIIISACHAGAFVPFLADERTMVITAAAAERTSFGCSDDRDLTYFGEAFVRDALPGAASMRAAFDAARRTIAAREHADQLEPSEPTAYFGSAIEAKLRTIEQVSATAPPAGQASR